MSLNNVDCTANLDCSQIEIQHDPDLDGTVDEFAVRVAMLRQVREYINEVLQWEDDERSDADRAALSQAYQMERQLLDYVNQLVSGVTA